MSGCLSKTGSSLNKVIRQPGLTRHTYQIGETQGVIITDYPPAITTALDCIKQQRKILFDYIRENPAFETSLEPVEVGEAPEVVQLMAEAAATAGVGPMAAVAGVIADLAAETMIRNNAYVAVVENGGEAALYSERPLVISVGAGNNLLSDKVGFKVKSFPCGVATSSGRHSHAYSKGDADSVTVFAENAGIADAAATAAANMVNGVPGEDVKAGVDAALQIRGVFGALAIRDENISLGGALPQIVSVED
ncbi:UPF0280 family protein [Candidatus Bathyarchaeota archaeon]|nr:UPF0280 family protein [Candidatus Bathyarchaeota archaeon]